jgi:type II secretory pathway predicted ATPase ExeA
MHAHPDITISVIIVPAKGAKEGIEKGVTGFKKFLTATAETLHLKKPDMHALDEFEEEISPYLPTEVAKRWYKKNVKLKPEKGKGKLVLKWNRVFCWYENPFTPEIHHPIENFFVYEKKKKALLNLFFVKKHGFGTITGDAGSGKTMFLHWIKWELDNHHPEVVACYVDCRKNVSAQYLIKQVMAPFLNIYQKTVSRPFEEMNAEPFAAYIKKKVGEKTCVLLIDQPHNLHDDAVALVEALQKSVALQIIVAGQQDELRKSKIGKAMKDTMKVHLAGLDPDLASEMLQRRIEAVGGEGTYPFDAQKIRVLCQKTGGNPLQLLHLAKEKVIQLSVDHRDELIAQQQEIAKKKQEEIERKYKEEKKQRFAEKENKRKEIEEMRRKHENDVLRQKEEEEKKYREILEKEDTKLEKIDDLIGAVIGGSEKKDNREDKSQLAKNDAVVEEAVGNIPEEKTVREILDSDADLAADLKHVFEETADAGEHDKKTQKKKGRR